MSGRKNFVTLLTTVGYWHTAWRLPLLHTWSSIILIFVFAAPAIAAGKIIYVDDDANGLNNGSSWADAYNYLQDALADANSLPKPVEIRIAEGIYKTDQGVGVTPGDRKATFQLKNGVTVNGGYAGLGQPDPNNRNIDLYKTILSGDLDGNDVDVNDPCDLLTEPTRAENSYNVVTSHHADPTSVLDGFTVTGGNADGLWEAHQTEGGGIYNNASSPTLNNLTLIWNSAFNGGGMHCDHSSPILTNCAFICNSVEYMGGGMCNEFNSDSILTNCVLNQNWSGQGGGGMYNWDCSPTLTNCTFSGNWNDAAGGGMDNFNSSPKLTNCTFSGNSTFWSGGGMFNFGGSPTLTNCTFIRNKAVGAGGGVSNCDSSLTSTGCTFIANSADCGGGMDNGFCSPTLTNCTFSGNSATILGGGMCSSAYSSPILTNCIMWGNTATHGHEVALRSYWEDHGDLVTTTTTLSYSDIEGGPQGVFVDVNSTLNWGKGNINVDPCFAQSGYWDHNGTPSDVNDDFWVDGDYHLKSQAGRWDANEGRWTKDEVTSLCIDAGDPASPIGLEPFPNGGIINMGAYGGTSEASKSYFGEPPCETIVAGDINGDCIVNFKDFAIIAFHWLEEH